MQEEYIKNSTEQDSTINVREELEKYLMQWRWFVLSALVFLILAFFYLRYSTPIYKSTTTILVKDDRKGGIANELSAFSELGLLSGVKSNVDNEIEIIKSRTLVEKTIKDLNLNIKYYNKGRIKDGELYENLPFKAIFSNYVDKFYTLDSSFLVTKKDDQKFSLFDENNKKIGDFTFGQKIKLPYTDLVVVNQYEDSEKKDYSVLVQLVPLKSLVESFSSRLVVSALSKNTSVIELSLTDPTKIRAEEFLNTLVSNYNEDAIADKNLISKNTSEFIDQRLVLISKELKEVESDEESFKKKNKITDIPSEAGLFLENASEFEKKSIENETQIRVVAAMSEYINSNDNQTIPATIITSESGASELINQYNQLVLKKNNLIEGGAGPENITVLAIDKQLTELKKNVDTSLKSLKKIFRN